MFPYSGVPEIYVFMGILIFLALSFVTHFFNVAELFGHYLSGFLIIIYPIIATIGLGQMYITNFVIQTDIKIRAILSFAYLVIAIINVTVFLIFTVKRNRYLYYYFRFTSVPIFLRLFDAISKVKEGLRKKRTVEI